MKRCLSLLCLALVLALALPVGALAENADAPAYTYTDIPLWEGDEPATLSIARRYQYNSRPTEELWFWKFAEKYLNIKFEVETTEDLASYTQLAFAAGTMPDIWCNMSIDAAKQMTYGALDGLIVDLAPYIDNGTMKNLAAVYEEHPAYRTQITAHNGAIYSVGLVRDSDIPGLQIFWNTRWLKEAGYEIPTTLDEMIEAAYAIKEQRGADAVPLGGGFGTNNPLGYVLNAFGYITDDGKGEDVCLRNGKVVIPYGDREVFGDYLKLVNQFYADGIISPDYYTLDDNTFRAQCGEDKVGMMRTAPYVIMPETFDEWDAVIPLASEYNNNTRQWPNARTIVTTGSALVTTNCENVELAARFIDWFYNAENCILANNGPTIYDEDYKMGLVGGWYLGEDYSEHYADVEKGDSGFESNYDYRMGRLIGTHWEFGLDNQYDVQQKMFGLEPIGRQYNAADGDDNYRLTVIENLLPYAVDAFPHIRFFDADTTEKMSDLSIALNSYAEEETAKFITGARSLDTLGEYFDTLESMGFNELLQYYVDYYENYTASK